MYAKTLAAAVLALTFTQGAHAAEQNYAFSGVFDSGSLLGKHYAGTLRFDDAALAGGGDEFLPISSLSVQFDEPALSFSQNDAEPGSIAEAFFTDGVFLGALFSAGTADNTFSFSLVPGFFDIGEAFLAYDGTAVAEAGFGTLVYAPVPEPRDWMLLLAGIVFVGLMVERAKRRQI